MKSAPWYTRPPRSAFAFWLSGWWSAQGGYICAMGAVHTAADVKVAVALYAGSLAAWLYAVRK